MYVRAVRGARELVYLETQYLTSRAVFDALVARFRDETAPTLDVVVVLPERAEAFKEELAHGLRQARLVRELGDVARERGHRIGFYSSRPGRERGELDGPCTYIHAKIAIVDDRFLTVGAANLTNRSMGLDTEINLAWEDDEPRFVEALEAARLSLLGEHTGLGARAREVLGARRSGLVDRLDALAERGDTRLEKFDPTTVFDEAFNVEPPDLAIDPDDSCSRRRSGRRCAAARRARSQPASRRSSGCSPSASRRRETRALPRGARRGDSRRAPPLRRGSPHRPERGLHGRAAGARFRADPAGHVGCTPEARRQAMAKLVTGLFESRTEAEAAVDALVKHGFAPHDISVLMTETTRGREFTIREKTKAPEGAATGAAIGGVLGGVAAGLVAVGAIALPGLGLVAAGPILAALAGAGAGGATGGVLGAAVGATQPEHEAKLVRDGLQRGEILVGVYTHGDEATSVRDVLASTGGSRVAAS